MYQVIRKLTDDFEQQHDGQSLELSVSGIYELISHSNSSLNRRNKRSLEGSIERVISVMQSEDTEDDWGALDRALEGQAFQQPESNHDDDRDHLNRKIVHMWSRSPPPLAPSDERPRRQRKRPLTHDAPPRNKKAKTHQSSNHVSLADMGGVDDVVQKLQDLVVLPIFQPDIFRQSHIKPPRGILLHGPPGCGKTMIAAAFATELGVPFFSISAPSIVAGMAGESEKLLRDYFESAKKAAPCLLFIDEIDAITPKRDAFTRTGEKRLVAQLLTCMDDLALEKTGGKAVVVLAATNRPDSLDPALRRGGRFDKEINMNVPNEEMRERILIALTRHMKITGDLSLRQLAKATPGFVGADLSDLITTAGSIAVKRFLSKMKSAAAATDLVDNSPMNRNVRDLRLLVQFAKGSQTDDFKSFAITASDFEAAVPQVQPYAKREGFTTVPETTWDDVGALQSVREELCTAIIDPIRHPERYARVGITAPTGVLLWGPPGCGKTLLAKAVANQSRANFISVKGPELLHMYVGESERAVRQLFTRARASAPCIIFFDELDALVPTRDDRKTETTGRVVNTMLAELDGLNSREGIYVVGATNRPDIIDPAMLRPGRLETLFYVDLPSGPERVEILRTMIRKLGIDFDERLQTLASSCNGFSGADLGALLRRAGYLAIRRNDALRVEDFEEAKKHVKPSVVDRSKYERLKAQWRTRS